MSQARHGPGLPARAVIPATDPRDRPLARDRSNLFGRSIVATAKRGMRMVRRLAEKLPLFRDEVGPRSSWLAVDWSGAAELSTFFHSIDHSVRCILSSGLRHGREFRPFAAGVVAFVRVFIMSTRRPRNES